MKVCDNIDTLASGSHLDFLRFGQGWCQSPLLSAGYCYPSLFSVRYFDMEFQCYCGTWREISDQDKCRTRGDLYMHVHANGTRIKGMFSAKVVKSRWNVVAWRQSKCLDVGVQGPDRTDWLGFATTVVLFLLLLDFLHFFWEKSPTHYKSSSAKCVAIILMMMLLCYLTLFLVIRWKSISLTLIEKAILLAMQFLKICLSFKPFACRFGSIETNSIWLQHFEFLQDIDISVAGGWRKDSKITGPVHTELICCTVIKFTKDVFQNHLFHPPNLIITKLWTYGGFFKTNT